MYKKNEMTMSSRHFPATILGQNQNRKWLPSYRGLSVDWPVKSSHPHLIVHLL